MSSNGRVRVSEDLDPAQSAVLTSMSFRRKRRRDICSARYGPDSLSCGFDDMYHSTDDNPEAEVRPSDGELTDMADEHG